MGSSKLIVVYKDFINTQMYYWQKQLSNVLKNK